MPDTDTPGKLLAQQLSCEVAEFGIGAPLLIAALEAERQRLTGNLVNVLEALAIAGGESVYGPRFLAEKAQIRTSLGRNAEMLDHLRSLVSGDDAEHEEAIRAVVQR